MQAKNRIALLGIMATPQNTQQNIQLQHPNLFPRKF